MRPGRLGLGSLQFPVLGQPTVDRIVAVALDGGIRAFDTAVRYGSAEEMLGVALARHSAGSGAFLCAKTHVRSRVSADADIVTSLKRLGRGRLDVYMVHDVRWGSDYDEALAPGGAVAAIVRRKELGDVGLVGLSTHRPETALKAAREPTFDALMLPANIVDAPAFAPAVQEARGRGAMILGMKALAGGALLPAAAALRSSMAFAYDTVFVGVRSEEELRADLDVVTGATAGGPSPSDESAALDDAARALGGAFCHRCGYCLPCPAGLPIPDIFHLWRYVTVYHSGDLGGFGYRKLAVKADACDGCGRCEERCSYGLPIRTLLKTAHFDLTVGVAMGKGQ